VRRLSRLLAILILPGACSGGQAGLGGDDQDGVVGGNYTFEITVDDSDFSPTAIWKTQNVADVTLSLKNEGTRPHGFRVRCLAVASAPSGMSCFPKSASVAPLDPGASATTKFRVPYPEGIYDVDDGTDVPSGPTGQFIIQ
jgi:hypothetical protein